jgi:hypothetical protein
MKTRTNLRLILCFFLLSTGCPAGGADLRAKYDVCFKEDAPGANDRYVEFTPVRCSDERVKLGAPVGGERAVLEFEDTDADGTPEIVVSSLFRCRWSFEPCLNPTRTIVKVSGSPDAPQFSVVRVEMFPPHPEFR